MKAAAAGKRVCTSDTGSSGSAGTGKRGAATLTAASGRKTFSVGSCTSSGGSGLRLRGLVDNMTLAATASGGKGTVSVTGGTESDDLTLKGTITSVTVGDTGGFMVKGTFAGTNLWGERFTLTGTCA